MAFRAGDKGSAADMPAAVAESKTPAVNAAESKTSADSASGTKTAANDAAAADHLSAAANDTAADHHSAAAADHLSAADEAEYLEKIAREHAGLVRSVALRLSYACGEELDDLVQIGYIGLIKAAKRFEPERGLRFSTYAVPMITGEIKSQLRDQGAIKVSRSLKSDAALIKKAQNEFITTHGVSPKLSRLAEMTGLSRERIAEALSAADAMKNFEDYEKTDLWTDNEERNITKIDLRSSIESLPKREKQVILLRYYKDYTQQQVADIMGISQVQVCRIEKNSLKQLEKKIFL